MAEPLPVSAPKDLWLDAASALWIGHREQQEDAVVTDFSRGGDFGFAVLADGMGGHASGEIASKIVVTEMFSDLVLQRNDMAGFVTDIPGALTRAAASANDCLQAHAARHPQAHGMGATLVTLVIVGDALHWLSVGDSPLYLFRDNTLRQLNEDHSMAPEIDLMASRGEIDEATARSHPERHVLTSVLFGAEIPRIDCPRQPFRLFPGDTLVVASDGLQPLDRDEIAGVLRAHPLCRSDQLARFLLEKVGQSNAPDQDNVSLAVIRVNLDDPRGRTVPLHRPERQGFPGLKRVSRLWQDARMPSSPVDGRRAP